MPSEEIIAQKDTTNSVQNNESLTTVTIQKLAKFDFNLANDKNEPKINLDSDHQLERLNKKLNSLDSNSPHAAFECIQITTKIQQIIKTENSVFSQSTFDKAMVRLEQEFVNLIVRYKKFELGPEISSFRSTEEYSEDYSFNSFGDDLIDAKNAQNECIKVSTEQNSVDLVNPLVIPTLKCIADLIFASNYNEELTKAYISTRIDAMDAFLSSVRFEKFSIEEILNMDWSELNSLIKRWNWILKFFVRVYLTSERRLAELIFGEISKNSSNSCFFEISKVSMLHLLSFGEAVAIGSPKPEKIFRILDMYDILGQSIIDIETLFHNDDEYNINDDNTILIECNEVQLRLGELAKRILMEFRHAIQADTSKTVFANGEVHPVARYVMNYIKTLSVYDITLNSLLGGENGKEQYYNSVTTILELNLELRSCFYEDEALRNIFMMNCIFYMVQKVKDSDVRNILGDNWIRVHNKRFQKYAMNYERAAWGPVLSFLKEEGICQPKSRFPSKSVLKERFKGFNSCFEEAYRVQTGWIVPDLQLRDDLRISVSLKVLQAYRTFVGRYANYLDGIRFKDRYVKYRPEDLERFLLDLFDGVEKSLRR
ncbi:hypothetical protein LUZ60_001557 [Juncus effusus]|nr:hypothetical protein LUZ60_001557 [Juncus effusus]